MSETRVVTVVDYGRGNLFSVRQAFEKCGATVITTSDPAAIRESSHLVLPGVGAFADGMAALRERGLVEILQERARTGRPFFGICLGMQLMFDESEEFGTHRGLGLVAGSVRRISAVGKDGSPHKIPHIGWNALHAPTEASWERTILASTRPAATVYFVHSYAAVPANPRHTLAYADYDGLPICATVSVGGLVGCQFHPEKSGEAGLGIIGEFLRQSS